MLAGKAVLFGLIPTVAITRGSVCDETDGRGEASPLFFCSGILPPVQRIPHPLPHDCMPIFNILETGLVTEMHKSPKKTTVDMTVLSLYILGVAGSC
jgi:hypothetical protein